jgi:hypothetical protein
MFGLLEKFRMCTQNQIVMEAQIKGGGSNLWLENMCMTKMFILQMFQIACWKKSCHTMSIIVKGITLNMVYTKK